MFCYFKVLKIIILISLYYFHIKINVNINIYICLNVLYDKKLKGGYRYLP